MGRRTGSWRSRWHAFAVSLALVSVAGMVGSAVAVADDGGGGSWPMIGHDPFDSFSSMSGALGAGNVDRLAPRWVATTTGDVSATPAVVGGSVYFPDFGGTLWKLNARSGAVIWSHKVADYTGIAGDVSRSSPALARGTLIVGDQKAGDLMGIDPHDGTLRWLTPIDPSPKAIITGSPVIAGGIAYVGVSASGASGPTATFRGSVVAVDVRTGRILWKTYSVPDNGGIPGGYAGGTVIAPPTVDQSAGLVFVTFGNFYTEPASVAACNAAVPVFGISESCEQPGSHWSSLAALDIRTGQIVWAYRVEGQGPETAACGATPLSWCPAFNDHVSWDFGGSGPNVFQIGSGRHAEDVVGVGEKSGVYIVLDARTGRLVWNTLVGPGSDLGGMEWGTATDGRRIYVAIGNENRVSYTLTPSGAPDSGGSWAALDPATGRILWQTADPGLNAGDSNFDLSPLSVANGVVFAGSMAQQGNEMYALNAATGRVLWSYSPGESVNAAPAVVGGTVYWGAGYAKQGPKIGDGGRNEFFAFSVEGR